MFALMSTMFTSSHMPEPNDQLYDTVEARMHFNGTTQRTIYFTMVIASMVGDYRNLCGEIIIMMEW